MMKKIIIWVINLYQKTPINTHGYCKFTPSCSEYTKEAVEKFGVIKGLTLGIKRILRCNPFGKGGYDPVPKERKRK